ncbi:MAG: transposase, partial [Oscillospiraceae bacterium]|nr:transposase [Oscillospiraceae bacterium]
KNNTRRQSIDISERKIKLPKLGRVECRVSKQIEGRILSATVIRQPSGKYFVSVCCTEVDPAPPAKTGAAVGIRMGVRNLATLSDGRQFENIRAFEKSKRKTARLQREMSRKQKDSANREKAGIKLARAYEKVSDRRNDFLHKLTTRLVREYDIICIRDESLSETAKDPMYAKYVSDAGWGTFVRQLEYKCAWYGKELIKVSRWHPSTQLCGSCGHRAPEVSAKTSLKEWVCPACGARHDRAVNAAVNILKEGLAQKAAEQKDVRPDGPEVKPAESA